jgi:hypothetical protein
VTLDDAVFLFTGCQILSACVKDLLRIKILPHFQSFTKDSNGTTFVKVLQGIQILLYLLRFYQGFKSLSYFLRTYRTFRFYHVCEGFIKDSNFATFFKDLPRIFVYTRTFMHLLLA